jgi:hypothetical protein
MAAVPMLLAAASICFAITVVREHQLDRVEEDAKRLLEPKLGMAIFVGIFGAPGLALPVRPTLTRNERWYKSSDLHG